MCDFSPFLHLLSFPVLIYDGISIFIEDEVALGVCVVDPQKLCFFSLKAIPAKASVSVGDKIAFESSTR